MRERTISREHKYRGVSITKLCGVKGDYFPWSCAVDGKVVVGKTKKDILHKIDLILD